MEWIDIKKQQPPKQTCRYLIMTKCLHKYHNCLAWNYPFPCCEVTIAYFDCISGWHYETGKDWDVNVFVTHYMSLPPEPKEQ